MSKTFSPKRLQTLLATLVLLTSLSSWVMGDDHFAISVDSQGSLVIFGPKGEKAATLPAPSVSQPVTVGSTSFQVSYGRDANDLLTAIIAPNSSQPQDLHFNVMSKSVDADKQAVVTLTFSQGLNHVNVDPGYIGTVTVNSHTVKHHELADNSAAYAPAPAPANAPAPAPRTTADVAPRDLPSTSADYTPSSSYDPSASASTSDDAGTQSHGAPLMSPPLIGSLAAQPPPLYALNSSPAGGAPPDSKKMFWSEPITPLKGPAPTVALNQMKLVQVQGPVTVKLPNGDTKDGANGMIVPSGSTVMTSSDSSAAVFMGGVNSARLMPNCEMKVSQNLNGQTRKTTIDLVHGAVFSRIGHRPGETQDYQVVTPEGVAAARGTEMLTYRGNLNNLYSPSTTTSGISASHLLAWSPTSLQHGMISDEANPMLATAATTGNSLYVFVAKGSVTCSINGVVYTIVSGGGGVVGSSAMPKTDDANINAVLNAILALLQPFNTQLTQILNDIANGTATDAEVTLYNELVLTSNSLGSFIGDMSGEGEEFEDYPNILDQFGIPLSRRALNQDLVPFGTNPITPGPFIPSN